MLCPYIIEFAVKHHSCAESPRSLKANVHAAAKGMTSLLLVVMPCLP